MQQRRQISKRTSGSELDWGIILALLLFMIIGLSALFEAATHMQGATAGVALRAVIVQGGFWFIGGLIIVFLLRFDESQLWRLAPIAYGLGVFLLVAVLIFYNRSMALATGAKSWFVFGPISFQPSEVVKPAFILMLARVVAQHNRDYPTHAVQSDWILLGKMALVFLPLAALIALQNDLGTLLVFIAIFGGVTLVSGVTWRILAPVIIAGVVLGTTLLTLVISTAGRAILSALGFQSYQFARIDTWLHPATDTSGDGYQTYQSLKAIGSGQLTGNGWGALKVYVPVRESDMIFSVIGESFGFIGGALLIALYFGLIYLLVRATFRAQSAFYAYIATGVVMLVLFHVFENIGMSIGLLPLTGIPLPFISQGGSSLIGNLIGVGLVLSISYQKKNTTFTESTGFSI
ncbi:MULTISPECIES: FtsW/RodA/SpoVE family cell cycle protein [Leuconostoc]|uniref:Rod shape-determining protein RodA n=1 Tax=Leuconostoc pseudomesenteroides TaxID=33968 RepID=A0A1X0VET6_LEUPS|nr:MULTISPECIES: FtsW/RodA/SpoVE family cell cycle protein [Leuconostoc]KDA47575.1 Cell division protein FtsW [Leuconostoc pseudomesenteroides 1159]KDA50458.1 Cell division protein FtsW [Leuconostoc pseudomesenteroides PS12]CCJ66447.1 Cell division protein FtsW [Leuconostoc pseudomesenteroides 4882]MCT4404020.1 rod shape-determining protein RodA [Leuconostoc falkenbergense]MCT4419718.1 rod shape-determining protein RodA [Leuconostoc falkenbergense]